MRITLAEWRDKYGLTVDGTRDGGLDLHCSGCSWSFIPSKTEYRVSLCSYHEGFVDGFDTARGGG